MNEHGEFTISISVKVTRKQGYDHTTFAYVESSEVLNLHPDEVESTTTRVAGEALRKARSAIGSKNAQDIEANA